jgi:hypothetical protein
VIRGHYQRVRQSIRGLEQMLEDLPAVGPHNEQPVNPKEMTAILLVRGFNGFGLHTLLSIVRNFPDFYKNYIFVEVAEIDSGTFKGIEQVEALKASVTEDLMKYVKVTRRHGLPADYRMAVGTDVVDTATELCASIVAEFPRSTIFSGKLVFKRDRFFHRILHNETAFAIQSRLQWMGIATVILPIRTNI